MKDTFIKIYSISYNFNRNFVIYFSASFLIYDLIYILSSFYIPVFFNLDTFYVKLIIIILFLLFILIEYNYYTSIFARLK